MARDKAKGFTFYLQGKDETSKDQQARVKKIEKVRKQLGSKETASAAVRLIIDAYQPDKTNDGQA